MYWGDKRYNNLNCYLKNKFGEKVYKLCFDGGFSCPNRDGKLSREGCIFCSERGAGEFTGTRGKSISEQAKEQIELVKDKWKSEKYIAYFQNFTNTYAEKKYLYKIYQDALDINGVVGLAIATRPDCIDDDVIEVLKEYNKKTFLWVELGLQTINEDSAKFINRAYDLDCFEVALKQLNDANINVVVHFIYGLPGENKENMLADIDYISQKKVFGIKIHSLYISKGTRLYDYYINNNEKTLTKDEYIDIVVESIERLNPNIVIHRLTGDPQRSSLYLPKWTTNKSK